MEISSKHEMIYAFPQKPIYNFRIVDRRLHMSSEIWKISKKWSLVKIPVNSKTSLRRANFDSFENIFIRMFACLLER